MFGNARPRRMAGRRAVRGGYHLVSTAGARAAHGEAGPRCARPDRSADGAWMQRFEALPDCRKTWPPALEVTGH